MDWKKMLVNRLVWTQLIINHKCDPSYGKTAPLSHSSYQTLKQAKGIVFFSCNFCFSQFHNLSFIKSDSCESQHLQQLTQHFNLQHSPMENSNIDSEVFSWFQNQNQNHCLKFHSSCFPPTSQSALYGIHLFHRSWFWFCGFAPMHLLFSFDLWRIFIVKLYPLWV